MTEVVSVKFRGRGKSYYFAPNGVTARTGDKVVVETAKGMELGDCVWGNHQVEDNTTVQPLRPVVRLATSDDLRIEELNRKREKEALGICRELIAKHKLEMKLVDVECSFEGNKILFFFTADGRVDFRELVRDLAGVFRTRIELRQIGVRDEAKMLGGLGICGRPFCCSQFLDDFQPVSTKMAKTQSMSLNPVKISGTCGRLMCCLRYEQEAYEDLVKHVPKNGAFVQTEDGYGNVTLVNLLRQSVKVRLDRTSGDPDIRTYDVDDIAEVPGGRPAEGQPLPDVLSGKPKKTKEAPLEPENDWLVPDMIADSEAAAAAGEAVPEEEKSADAARRNNRRRRGGRGKGDRPEKPERTEKPERAEKPERTEKAAKGEKTERREKGERSEKAPRAEKADKPQRTEKGEKAARTEKVEKKRPEKSAEKAEKRPESADKGDRSEKSGQSHRNNRRRHKPRPQPEAGSAKPKTE